MKGTSFAKVILITKFTTYYQTYLLKLFLYLFIHEDYSYEDLLYEQVIIFP